MKLRVLNDTVHDLHGRAGSPGGGFPYVGTGQRKDGDAVTELKELVSDLAKKAADGRTAVEQKHADIDGRVAKITEEIERRDAETVEAKTAFQDEVAKVIKLEKDLDDLIQKMDGITGGAPEQQKHWAQLAAESDALKTYSGGNVTLLEHEGPAFKKDILSTAGTAGQLIEPFVRPGILTPPEQPLTIRDLLATVPIATNNVEWAREDVFTNAAAMQAGDGATKPKSDLTFTKENSPVQTLAHWFAASRQVLADVNALQQYIVNRGTYGLKLVEEQQLLAGDGVGNNLTGILPQATAYNAALNNAGDTNIDQLRHAVLQVRESFYALDSFVMDPASWCDIELTKDANLIYMFTNPVNGAGPRLWGKRIVEADSMAANTFLGGSFSMGATLWDRELVTVRVSEHHADFFIQNMVAILIEERLALTVERPTAFVTGTFIA